MHVAESREVGAHVAVSRRSRGCVIGARGLLFRSSVLVLAASPCAAPAFSDPASFHESSSASKGQLGGAGLTNLARLESHPHVSVTECTVHIVDEDAEEIVRFATPTPRRTVQRNRSNRKIT